MKKKILGLFFMFILTFSALIIGLNMPVYATNSDFSYQFLNDGTIAITSYNGTSNNVTIPATIDGYKVTKIASWAFEYNERITYVTISEGITYLGDYAFYGCTNINSIVIPKSVTYIDWQAISYCQNLQTIKILNPYCAISSYAFGSYPSEKLTIYADKGSTAQTYANNNGINFVIYDTHGISSEQITKATTTTNGKVEVKCNYCGKIIKTTTINKISSISLSKTSYTYDGEEKKPTVTVKDSSGKTISSNNYTVSYSKGRKNAGSYTVTINFKNYYSGTVKKTYTIKKRTLKNSNVKMLDIVYTGKSTQPKITYKGKTLKKNTDYKISKISKNKNIGTANLTIKMQGNYTGTIKTTYKIVPDKVKGISLKSRDESSLTIKWKKVKGAEGYKVYRWSSKKFKYVLYKTTKSTSMKVKRYYSEEQYVDIMIKPYKKVGNKTYNGEMAYYYNCVKPGKLKYSVTCSNIGKIRINYKDVKNYKCIQIQLCINKSFNDDKYDVKNFYTNISNYSENKYKEIYNLTSNKTYYVRCREYNYSRSGNPVYGKWGDVKKIYVQ